MFERLLEQIAAELASRSLPYLIVGGQAVLVHGEPRLTRVIDVTLGVDVDRLDDLLAIVTHAGWNVLVQTPRDFVQKTSLLKIGGNCHCEEPKATKQSRNSLIAKNTRLPRCARNDSMMCYEQTAHRRQRREGVFHSPVHAFT